MAWFTLQADMDKQPDANATGRQVEDGLFPSLDLSVRERSLYYPLFRHTRFIDKVSGTFAVGPLADALEIAHSSVRDALRTPD